jgi:hypothetical protein
MRANRLLSHCFSSKFFLVRALAEAATDRGHSIGAAWNWHPFAVGHTPAQGTAILLRSRAGTDGSNPLPSSRVSRAKLPCDFRRRRSAPSASSRDHGAWHTIKARVVPASYGALSHWAASIGHLLIFRLERPLGGARACAAPSSRWHQRLRRRGEAAHPPAGGCRSRFRQR